MRTPFTELVGCQVPVQLASMPGISTPALALAVANAGGLGMIGAPMLSAELLAAELASLREHGSGAIGVNFLMPFLDRGCVPVAAAGARVVEFFYGNPDPALVELAHAGGALASWQVGSRGEALAAAAAGCDLIVAQGSEAGGHVRGRISLLPLLAQVLDAVSIPVLAAGGIATDRDVAAALAAGAAGVRVGTRFATALESGAHPAYVEALLRAEGEDTVLTASTAPRKFRYSSDPSKQGQASGGGRLARQASAGGLLVEHALPRHSTSGALRGPRARRPPPLACIMRIGTSGCCPGTVAAAAMYRKANLA
jgi:NAD(P)H-dependent flavin oxidoreductase YrpB (nitropropane dioxygenase family)